MVLRLFVHACPAASGVARRRGHPASRAARTLPASPHRSANGGRGPPPFVGTARRASLPGAPLQERQGREAGGDTRKPARSQLVAELQVDRGSPAARAPRPRRAHQKPATGHQEHQQDAQEAVAVPWSSTRAAPRRRRAGPQAIGTSRWKSRPGTPRCSPAPTCSSGAGSRRGGYARARTRPPPLARSTVRRAWGRRSPSHTPGTRPPPTSAPGSG